MEHNLTAIPVYHEILMGQFQSPVLSSQCVFQVVWSQIAQVILRRIFLRNLFIFSNLLVFQAYVRTGFIALSLRFLEILRGFITFEREQKAVLYADVLLIVGLLLSLLWSRSTMFNTIHIN